MKKRYNLILFSLFSYCASFAQPTTFNYTGSVQTYTVPSCVTSVTIEARGAKGGGANGGNGAVVTGTITVTPGQVLEVYVGGMGTCPGAGFNGGGAGGNASNPAGIGCGGGGASDVRIAPYGLTDRVIVASGGGGMGGGTTDGLAGGGGCATGANGSSPFGQGGFGATQTAGGNGGPPWIANGNAGQPGTLGIGGAGAVDPCFNVGPGGGGGGGYYGGGGGGSDCFGSPPLGGGGGGGGSSLTPAAGSCTAATNNTDGVVIITPATGGMVVTFTPAAPVICAGQTVQIVANGAVSYNWFPSTGLNMTTGNVVNANPTTTTTYSVGVSDGGGCTDTVSITVTVNPIPVITVNPAAPVVCSGVPVTLTASGATTYSWLPGTGLSATTGASVNASPAGTQTYIVSGTALGCTGQTTVTVSVSANPVINFVPANPTYCAGQSTPVTATGASTYVWSPATGLSSTTGSTVTASGASTQTYTVTGTNAAGCSSSANVTVTVNPLPTVNAGNNQIICLGDSTLLSGTSVGGSSFSWTPAVGLDSPSGLTTMALPTTSTTYTLTVTDANGCVNTDMTTVTVNNVVSAFTANPVLGEPPLPVLFQDLSTGNPVLYYWNYGDGDGDTTSITSIAHTFANAGTYTIMLVSIDANGCTDTSYSTVVVEFPFSIFIPNVISPNGDGNNDVFEVVSKGVTDMQITIFDRWGLVMFSSSDINGKWDGKREGKVCPEGTYFYAITVTSKIGETTDYKGTVTVLR